jgi:hypothetical protein
MHARTGGGLSQDTVRPMGTMLHLIVHTVVALNHLWTLFVMSDTWIKNMIYGMNLFFCLVMEYHQAEKK